MIKTCWTREELGHFCAKLRQAAKRLTRASTDVFLPFHRIFRLPRKLFRLFPSHEIER